MGDIARLLRSKSLVFWQIDERPDTGYRSVDRLRFVVRPFAETATGSGYFRTFIFSFHVELEPEIATQIVKELRFHLFLWRRTLDRVVAIYYGLLEDDDE